MPASSRTPSVLPLFLTCLLATSCGRTVPDRTPCNCPAPSLPASAGGIEPAESTPRRSGVRRSGSEGLPELPTYTLGGTRFELKESDLPPCDRPVAWLGYFE